VCWRSFSVWGFPSPYDVNCLLVLTAFHASDRPSPYPPLSPSRSSLELASTPSTTLYATFVLFTPLVRSRRFIYFYVSSISTWIILYMHLRSRFYVLTLPFYRNCFAFTHWAFVLTDYWTVSPFFTLSCPQLATLLTRHVP
jgi:hypothetical protein